MSEEEAFERYWKERQRITWDATLTPEKRASGKRHSPIWGKAFYADAKAAWMARAADTSNGVA